MPTSLRSHIFFSAVAFTILTTVGWKSVIQHQRYQANLRNTDTISIGIEHENSLGLTFTLSRKGRNGIIEVSYNDGTGPVLISVPKSWERREVRGAPLEQFTSDTESFGFVRWNLPPQATIEFWVSDIPAHIVAHNPSGVQLKIETASIELETEEVERNVFLLQDDPVPIF